MARSPHTIKNTKVNMKSVLITLTLTLIFGQSSAQWAVGDPKDADRVKQTTLAVVTAEKDEKLAKKLSKDPEELKAYEEGINFFNTTLKQIIESDWRSSKDIKFITESEAKKLDDSKDAAHSILRLVETSNYKMGDFYNAGPKSGFARPVDLHYHMSSTGKIGALSVTAPGSPNKPLVMAHLPSMGMTYASLRFMVQFMQHQLEDVNKGVTRYTKMRDAVDARSPSLNTKTLLVYDPMISKNLRKAIDDKSLEKDFPNKIKEVTLSELNEAVKANKQDQTYIIAIPSGAEMGGVTMHQYCVVDAADGRILFLTDKTIAGAVGQFHEYHFRLLSKAMKP
jgi:hypothetical protein